MKRPRPPAGDDDGTRAVLDMEREPGWAGGRFRLRRKPAPQPRSMPLWARLGLWLGWPVSVLLAAAAILTAALACGLLALAVYLPTLWR